MQDKKSVPTDLTIDRMNQYDCKNNLPVPIGSPTEPSEPTGRKTRITNTTLKGLYLCWSRKKWEKQ